MSALACLYKRSIRRALSPFLGGARIVAHKLRFSLVTGSTAVALPHLCQVQKHDNNTNCVVAAVRVRVSRFFLAGASRGNRGGGSGGGGGGGWERTEVALSLHGPGSGSSTTPLSDALERVVRLQVCGNMPSCLFAQSDA